jgi:hypothetical protein
MVDAEAANAIIVAGSAIFNPASEISRQYDQGLIGQVYGFKFYESEMTPTHTNGSRSDTTPVVDTSTTALESGSDSIDMTAFASSTTFAKGDVFTIAGVYAVNPETKVTLADLMQFSVKAAATAVSTAMTVTVYPTPTTSGAKKNCSVVAGSSAVVNLTAGGSGAASTGYINSLFYHKDAFTFVTADLELPHGVDFASRKVIDGISRRLVRQYDIVNDKFPCRIDVLFGQKAVRPEWACRVSS